MSEKGDTIIIIFNIILLKFVYVSVYVVGVLVIKYFTLLYRDVKYS